MFIVQEATNENIEEIAVLGRLLWVELGYCDVVEYDIDSVLKTCHNVRDNHVLLAAVEPNDTVVGFIAGVINPLFFNHKHKSLSELFWWVDQSWRSRGVGVELLRGFEDKAIENNCRFSCPMLHESATAKKAGELLEHLGYKVVEKIYIKEVPWVDSAQ